MIHEILQRGSAGALTADEISRFMNMSIREVTRQIERERRTGNPICASVTTPHGYYLADNAEELLHYVRRLRHRERELRKTRRALTRLFTRLYGEKTELQEENAREREE